MIAAQSFASIRATALVTELAVARLLCPVTTKLCRFGECLPLVLAGLALAEAGTVAVHFKDVEPTGESIEPRAVWAF